MGRGMGACAVIGVAVAAGAAGCAVLMPGDSYTGPLPLVGEEGRAVEEELRADVGALAGRIGERNLDHPDRLRAAEDYLAARLARAGLVARWRSFEADGVVCSNLEVEFAGRGLADEVVIVGAHYDSARTSPGANDNASGCAVALALARALRGETPERTLRIVFFANEEPPHFWTDGMGSLIYARDCKRRAENIVAMLSLETLGYYSDQRGSQGHPPPFGFFYPAEGNFVAFVGMYESRGLVERCVARFRASCAFPCEGAALTSLVPRVGSSDHWSFWKQGYPSLMVTDTAPYRYPHYHKPTDTPEKLDYERLARVTGGIEAVVRELAGV